MTAPPTGVERSCGPITTLAFAWCAMRQIWVFRRRAIGAARRRVSAPEDPHLHAPRDLQCSKFTHSLWRRACFKEGEAKSLAAPCLRRTSQRACAPCALLSRRSGYGCPFPLSMLRKEQRSHEIKVDRTSHRRAARSNDQTYDCPVRFPRAGGSLEPFGTAPALELSAVDEKASPRQRIEAKYGEGWRKHQKTPVVETVNPHPIHKSEFEGSKCTLPTWGILRP